MATAIPAATTMPTTSAPSQIHMAVPSLVGDGTGAADELDGAGALVDCVGVGDDEVGSGAGGLADDDVGVADEEEGLAVGDDEEGLGDGVSSPSMMNANSPVTGCPSSETTRYFTVYCPLV